MNLLVKITRFYIDAYRKELIECLTHNSNNSYIKSITVYTDMFDHQIKVPKTKVLFCKNLPTNTEIAKKCNKKEISIISNAFIKFNEDLNNIPAIDLSKFIFTNKNYIIFSGESKISERSSEEPIFEKDSKNINLNTDKISTNRNIIEIEKINRPNTLIKKSVYSPPPIPPTKRSKKLDVIIISVNYNDYLVLTLKHNIKIFDNITVVTSSDDNKCQEICKRFGVECVVTDVMYENESVFNKGKAINKGISSLKNPDLILLLDADIIVEEKINLQNLSDEVLYTSERIILLNYTSYKDYLQNGKNKRTKLENDKGYGFFQLFCIKNPIINIESPFPENFNDASYSDLEFRDKFKNRLTIQNSCLHLGEPFRNWKGRLTENFLTEEELKEQIESIRPFRLNDYFDKIYCLNLDRRKDKWQKVSNQFEKFKIEVQRWSAIDGQTISDETFDLYNPNKIVGEDASNLGIVENKNSIACLLSHLQIILDAKKNNYKRILIFEDDIIFHKDYKSRMSKVVNSEWKILYLGASQFDWTGIVIDNDFYRCKKTLGTFAYAIDCSLFDEIIYLLENGKSSIDNLLTQIQKKYQNDCKVLFPNVISCDVVDSDIRESKDDTEYRINMKWPKNKFEFKTVSVIIPCFGHSNFLEECVDSCLNQSILPEKILILLMDEESQMMKEIIENKSNRIECIISGQKKLSEARNYLVGFLETEYFIPLDADDKLPENFIEEITKIDSDVVYVGAKYFGDSDGCWPDPISEEINWQLLTTFRRNSLVCTALIKKDAFIQSGQYSENLWAYEDMDLWIKMYSKNYQFEKCFNTYLYYRKVKKQESLLSKANSSKESIQNLQKLITKNELYKRIPKIIHWVWIGEKTPPQKIVDTWKANLPEGEWEYKLWNETNFDMECCPFLKESYRLKKYGICVDYIRAKVLDEFGGIWLDADCVINKDISSFLQYDFFGCWENESFINIGLIGASKNNDIFKNILEYYQKIDLNLEEVLTNNNLFVKEIGTGPIVLTNEISKIHNISNGGFPVLFINNDKKFRIETPDTFVLDDSINGRVNFAVHLYDGSWIEEKNVKWSTVVQESYNNWKSKNKLK